MRVGIVVFPGSNCDLDCQDVMERLLGETAFRIEHKAVKLPPVDLVILPGGFSYGDYLRTGAMASASPVMSAVTRFAKEGGPVLGICNGFQILTEAALLPGAFLRNKGLQFICKPVFVKVENHQTPFTALFSSGEVLAMPIAHGYGNYYIDDAGLLQLQKNRQIVFRYCDPAGVLSEEANPNGSVAHIAGICNERGNILGMMPHPERVSDALLGKTDGLKLFRSLVENRWTVPSPIPS